MTDERDDCFFEDDSEDEDSWEDECGLGKGGYCSLAGTEHCDFVCPNRDSDMFRGSVAWRAKYSKRTKADLLPVRKK